MEKSLIYQESNKEYEEQEFAALKAVCYTDVG